MFDTFASVSHRFGQIRVPDEHLPGEWVSPYRLLFGAAYSIGAAERSLASRTGEATEVPVDLSSSLNGAIQDEGRTIAWLHFWRASYMLTNAIYRVAAAAEKICYPADPGLRGDRRRLWDAAVSATSALSEKLPKVYDLLGKMPRGRPARAAYLRAQRETFPGPMTVALPLVCAFIQTDIDKHVAYRPLKELLFDGTLAAGAFLEACDLSDAAIDAERGTR